jgi:exosome complex component RRP4
MSDDSDRNIVVPGDRLADAGSASAGQNAYEQGDGIYAERVGIVRRSDGEVAVIPLSGRYQAERGDLVIGTVVETMPTNWYIDVRAPSDVGMHVTDVPWRIDYGETSKYLTNGETVLLKVYDVDELGEVQVTMEDQECRKLSGGVTVDVEPSKVARIIGRKGSMIRMLKELTDTRMFVGQNGRIWIDGEPDDIALALGALRRIEAEAHTSGLTERVRSWINEQQEEGNYDELRREASQMLSTPEWSPHPHVEEETP